MKVLLAFATVVALSVTSAFAGDGQVSHQSLSKMGLSSMKAMSDTQGLQIRGMASVAATAGGSFADLGVSGGASTYLAAADSRRDGSEATGASASTAAVTVAGLRITATGATASTAAAR
jgi:hypothetical protein